MLSTFGVRGRSALATSFSNNCFSNEMSEGSTSKLVDRLRRERAERMQRSAMLESRQLSAVPESSTETDIPSLLDICCERVLCLGLVQTEQFKRTVTEDMKKRMLDLILDKSNINDALLPYLLCSHMKRLDLSESLHLRRTAPRWPTALKTLILRDCVRLEDSAIMSIAEHCHSLDMLDIGACALLSNASLRALRSATSLTHLDISECSFDDDGVRFAVEEYSSLRVLTMRECLNATWHEEPRVNTQMLSLCVSRTRADNHSVSNISKSLPCLRILDLSFCTKVKSVGVRHVSRLTNLFSLNLWSTGVDDNSFLALCNQCTKIESLTLSDCTEITEQSILSMIARLPLLRNITMWGCTGIAEAGFALLLRHRGTRLESLGLSHARTLGDFAMRALSGGDEPVTQLRVLSLEACSRLTGDAVNALGSTSLTSVNVRSCPLLTWNDGLEPLVQKSANLQKLEIGGCVALNTETTLMSLAMCVPATLQSINVAKMTMLSNSVLALIVQRCPNLTALVLDSCTSVTDAAMRMCITSLPRLRSLSFSWLTAITDNAFIDTRPPVRSLESVSAWGCIGLGEGAVRKFSEAPRLRSLGLAWCSEAVAQRSVLADLCVRCERINSINLSNSAALDDNGVAILAHSLVNLRRLDLDSCNKLTDSSLLVIADACANLRRLDVSNCHLINRTPIVRGNFPRACALARFVDTCRSRERFATLRLSGFQVSPIYEDEFDENDIDEEDTAEKEKTEGATTEPKLLESFASVRQFTLYIQRNHPNVLLLFNSRRPANVIVVQEQ